MSAAEACRAILILIAQYKPKQPPARQIQLLAALGEIKPAATGEIEAGRDLVLKKSGMTLPTFNLARTELIKDGLITYQPGQHRGDRSKWTINAPAPRKEGGKGRTPDQRKRNPSRRSEGDKGSPRKGVRISPEGGNGRAPDLGERSSAHISPVHINPARYAESRQRALDHIEQTTSLNRDGAELVYNRIEERQRAKGEPVRAPLTFIRYFAADELLAALTDTEQQFGNYLKPEPCPSCGHPVHSDYMGWRNCPGCAANGARCPGQPTEDT